jgi:CspA family cold shock protein
VFVHVSALHRGGSLNEGEEVSYELDRDRKTGKSKAENVSAL